MLIQTSELQPSGHYKGQLLGASEHHQCYCGLDSMLTLEVYQALREEHGSQAGEPIYSFERALQAPMMEIMQRGFLLDALTRREMTQELLDRQALLMGKLQQLSFAAWGKPLNPQSPKQLQEFFYGALRLPEVWLRQKGESKLSTNREALEKLEQYLYARPFVTLILSLREVNKQLEVLQKDVDSDGRFRTSYNIAGTETGRLSSSASALGTGGNAQNISPGLRRVFCSDWGKKLCVIDLEQVEARDVGFFCGCLFDDWSLLDACERGDLHTNNAKLVWPELDWSGDPKGDRKVADRVFYREYSFRDMAKRGSHLSNYSGSAWTMSRSLKIPLSVAEEFQARYARGRTADRAKGLSAIQPAYPCLPRWWAWTAHELQTKQELITPFGRRRTFFGRPGDDGVLRDAIAFMPQSTTADRTNLGLWRVWKHMPEVQLLAQTHDSITFQYDQDADEKAIIQRALELIRVELVSPSGRSYVVPGEAKVGWNWGPLVSESDREKAKAKGLRPPHLNLDGLKKWSSAAPDRRERSVGLRRLGQ